jgi:hypothetical protein
MKCDQVEELLSPYLEGDLSAEGKALVKEHLRTCGECGLLAASLNDTRGALTGFPELEVSPSLRARLDAIPERKKRYSFALDFLLKPSLQPVFAAATIFLTLLSFYFFNPNKRSIDRAIDQRIHLGYSQVEKLYARAESWTDRLGGYKDEILSSVKNWKIFGGNGSQTAENETKEML